MTANAPNPDANLHPDLHSPDLHSPESSHRSAEQYEAEIQALKAELEQTRLAQQMALEMAQFQAGFLARTSHELRSPINSVIGLHQLILSDLCDSPEEEREFVAQAYSAAQKMLGLMDELIQISQLVQNTARLNLEPVPLHEILAAVQQATHLQAKNRTLQLEIQLPDPSVIVLTDERRLRQVLIQLIDMPLRVMQQGVVRVATRVSGETVQIDIEDQRPAEAWQEPIEGLSSLKGSFAKDLEQVADKETMLQTLSRSPVPPSIGLQLFAQRAILELMGGQLTLLEAPIQSGEGQLGETIAESKPSLGTTRIRCTLPLPD